jgi:hypothetical protein
VAACGAVAAVLSIYFHRACFLIDGWVDECRPEEAEEGGADVRVPRRARHVGDAQDDGRAGAAGREGGRRSRGCGGGHQRQEEEERVEAVHLLLLRVLSGSSISLKDEPFY